MRKEPTRSCESELALTGARPSRRGRESEVEIRLCEARLGVEGLDERREGFDPSRFRGERLDVGEQGVELGARDQGRGEELGRDGRIHFLRRAENEFGAGRLNPSTHVEERTEALLQALESVVAVGALGLKVLKQPHCVTDEPATVSRSDVLDWKLKKHSVLHPDLSP